MTDAALRLDAYLEGLLARHGGGPRPGIREVNVPGIPDLEASDPALASAAEWLVASLVRFHPSFRFEEALASRLRAAAEGVRLPLAAGASAAEHRLLTFPIAAPELDAEGRERRRPMGILLGGAIASGVSLAGAAYLAWRRGHRGAP